MSGVLLEVVMFLMLSEMIVDWIIEMMIVL